MTRRRVVLGWVLLNAAGASRGQSKLALVGKRRLAVLMQETRAQDGGEFAQALRTALAEFGWIADRNLTIEWHFAEGDLGRLPALAEGIVRSRPDVILTYFVPATVALQSATTTIPIVTSVGDPIGFGFARSYAHPDANITGLSLGYVESQRKTIESLHVAVPAVTRLILAVTADRASTAEGVTRAAIGASRELGIAAEIVLVATAADLQAALRSDRTSAVSLYGFDATRTGEMIALALSKKVPTVAGNDEALAQGALLGYALYWDNQIQRNAAQVDKLLRGIKPAQIPFELPARSWLGVNRKTARALGLVLPPALLARADEVID